LRYKTLAIMVGSTFKGRRCGMDVAAIKGPNSVLKKRPELQVAVDFQGD